MLTNAKKTVVLAFLGLVVAGTADGLSHRTW
jgi:hypothetical protein